MAIHYIDENAVGTNDGTSWINAFRDSTTANDSASTLAGDTYWYASDHDYAYADLGNITLVFPDNCRLLSINKTNDEYLAGAKETVGFADDLAIEVTNNGAHLYIDGVSFICNDLLKIIKPELHLSLSNSSLTLTSAANSDYILIGATGGISAQIKNVDFIFSVAGQDVIINFACKVYIDGGSVNSICTDFLNLGSSGGAHVSVRNFDASAMTSGVLIDTLISTDDVVSVEFSRVKKAAVVEIYSGDLPSPACTIDAWSIDNGDGYHYFESIRYEGKVKESTYCYRVDGATYDGSNGFSSEYLPNANVVEYTQPLKFELGNYEIDLSSGADLTFHLLITGETAQHAELTNAECWIEAVHPDATDLALGVTVSSIAATITTTPVVLTASTESWTNEGTYIRKHQITVTVPTVALSKAAVSASLCMARILDNANEMFVCPDPEVV